VTNKIGLDFPFVLLSVPNNVCTLFCAATMLCCCKVVLLPCCCHGLLLPWCVAAMLQYVSRIPLVLLLFPWNNCWGLRRRPLGVTELSHYAHLIPIPLISNCIYVLSVHHCLVGYCFHVRRPVSTCALLFRLPGCVYCALVITVSPRVVYCGSVPCIYYLALLFGFSCLVK
jgi:hypothetical protein